MTGTNMYVWESCAKWVDELDRSELGSFAYPADVLIHAEYTMRSIAGEYDSISRAQTPVLQELCHKRGLSHIDALSEIIYWWQKQGRSTGIGGSYETGMRVRKLTKVAGARDELTRSFFENDVWDEEYIAQCIIDGIDPVLAKSLTA